jgi:hypothetical protein
MDKNTIIVNGKKISFTGNAVINIKKDLTSKIDKKFDTDDKSRMLIEINGDINDIYCDNANVLINGNTGKIILKEGNVKCNDVTGNIVCSNLECNNIKGDVNTVNDIICDTFIGNTNIGEVIDNFIPVKKPTELKEKMIIYHKKHGRGIINSIWNYQNSPNGGSLSIKFDNEDYVKTLFINKIINNKSLSIYNNENIIKQYNKEIQN